MTFLVFGSPSHTLLFYPFFSLKRKDRKHRSFNILFYFSTTYELLVIVGVEEVGVDAIHINYFDTQSLFSLSPRSNGPTLSEPTDIHPSKYQRHGEQPMQILQQLMPASFHFQLSHHRFERQRRYSIPSGVGWAGHYFVSCVCCDSEIACFLN